MPSQVDVSHNNSSVNKLARATAKAQRPICIWMTGLSGSGKSTIANMLECRLHENGFHTYWLDGDTLREGLNSDLGFSDVDRHENIRRTAQVARLMVDAGLIAIVSFISPFQADRTFARSLFENHEFCEVFIDAPIDECVRRDPKGLYAKAINGQLLNFTGISGAYEAPEYPDIHLYTQIESPEDSVDKLFKVLNQKINEDKSS